MDGYINVDDAVQTADKMSLTDIATSVQTPIEDNGEDDEDDDEPVLPQVSSKAVIQALAQVRTFLMQQGESTASNKAL